jgi:hypothetical protein
MTQEILGAVARAYCHPRNSHKGLDGDLAEAIAHEIIALDRLAAVALHPQPPDVHLAQAQGHAPAAPSADLRSLHTPGPWKPIHMGVSNWTITSPAHRAPIAHVANWALPSFDEETRANAHLIAAAPELLKELRDALGAGIDPDSPQGARARSAIAKAEGRS